MSNPFRRVLEIVLVVTAVILYHYFDQSSFPTLRQYLTRSNNSVKPPPEMASLNGKQRKSIAPSQSAPNVS